MRKITSLHPVAVLSTLLFSFFLLTPFAVFAQETGGFLPLVPCDGVNTVCDLCQLIKLGDNILNFLIAVSVILAVIGFAWAGFRMMTSAGNMGQVESAKAMFTNIIIGLIVLLAAWIIVDTLMKMLLNNELDKAIKDQNITYEFGLWNEITCGGVPWDDNQFLDYQLSHSNAAEQLSKPGIDVVSSGNCNDASNPSCTSLEGVQQSVIDSVIAIDQACPSCDIVVTSGSEGNGQAHQNSCHAAGTCVDIDCAGTCSVTEINTVISTAEQNGDRAVYEVITIERYQELLRAGVSPENLAQIGHASGEHFSLYGNPSGSD